MALSTRHAFQPGQPRPPGAGRKAGTPNKVSIDGRLLCRELCDDPAYQARLRHDHRLRRLHPTIEALVWSYGYGKPVQPVAVTDMTPQHDAARAALARLPLTELERLAAESQALLDRALALAAQPPSDGPPTLDMVPVESGLEQAGSEKQSYVNQIGSSPDAANPHGDKD